MGIFICPCLFVNFLQTFYTTHCPTHAKLRLNYSIEKTPTQWSRFFCVALEKLNTVL